MEQSAEETKKINTAAAFYLWFATLGYMGLIFYSSSLEETEASDDLLTVILNIIFERCSGIPYFPLFFDKLIHLFIYAVLGLLFYLSLRESGVRKNLFWLAAGFSVAYGITDEFHQSFIPGRIPSFGDLTADAFGAVLGCLAASGLISIWRNRS